MPPAWCPEPAQAAQDEDQIRAPGGGASIRRARHDAEEQEANAEQGARKTMASPPGEALSGGPAT